MKAADSHDPFVPPFTDLSRKPSRYSKRGGLVTGRRRTQAALQRALAEKSKPKEQP